ncbi:unnamed protein product [Cyprideis torosa]|uniref:Serine/threonine-protein kinase RIO2 n=1 Tax=Cyprideis torosa TaxID=163714 RepID=A0A7R8ZWE3_9CRUS|nr:unnamed protein product [Cyprideis torosa]CAG0905082.1 unnamed protein product [Cyprideis torosa]
MGKLNVALLRYLEPEDFRVLTAVEMGMKNHEIVNSALIASIANLKHGGVYKRLKELSKHRLLCFEKGKKVEGYRLTVAGYDFLALHTLCSRGLIESVGAQIGVGKEADIYEVRDPEGNKLCLKLHRLGRTSFRRVREKRDYHEHRNSSSWLLLSRLSATKEARFLEALVTRGFPVPRKYGHNRHAVLMELVDGVPLCQVQELGNPATLLERLGELITELASCGVIHCDFNEFNILVKEDESPVLIDFPQMVSFSHRDARMYFERDVECLRRFFERRFRVSPKEMDCLPEFDDMVRQGEMDVEAEASGWRRDAADSDNLDDVASEDSEDEEGGASYEASGNIEETAEGLLEEREKGPSKDPIGDPPCLVPLNEEAGLISDPGHPDFFESVSTVASTIAPEVARERIRREMGRRARTTKNPRAKGDSDVIGRKRREAKRVIKETVCVGSIWE